MSTPAPCTGWLDQWSTELESFSAPGLSHSGSVLVILSWDGTPSGLPLSCMGLPLSSSSRAGRAGWWSCTAAPEAFLSLPPYPPPLVLGGGGRLALVREPSTHVPVCSCGRCTLRVLVRCQVEPAANCPAHCFLCGWLGYSGGMHPFPPTSGHRSQRHRPCYTPLTTGQVSSTIVVDSPSLKYCSPCLINLP